MDALVCPLELFLFFFPVDLYYIIIKNIIFDYQILLLIVETKRRRVGGMNSLYIFSLSHHTYTYKKVRLYIR